MKFSKRDIIETIILVLISLVLIFGFIYFFNLSQERANDARRVADIKKIQSALAIYRHDTGSYPETLTSGEALSYQDNLYLDIIPYPQAASSNCPHVDTYSYSLKMGDNDSYIYNLEYCLGKETAGVPAGINTATPAGIRLK